MRFDVKGVLRHAAGLWRRDRDLLLRIAGPFFFLPQLAMLLFLPPLPSLAVSPEMTEAEQRVLAEQIVAWASAYGGWYLAGAVLVQAGSLVVLLLYLQRDRPTLGEGMARAARLLPRFLLAMILVGLPIGLGVLTLLLLLPGFYLLGRWIAVGPALAAEQPIGVLASLSRSWRLTRGAGFLLAGLVALPILAGAVLAAPFTAIDKSLRMSAPNVVAIALVDAGAAAVTSAALLATVLLQVAAYRALVASRGI